MNFNKPNLGIYASIRTITRNVMAIEVQLTLQIFKLLGVTSIMVFALSACSQTSWKEEVLLHDGQKIIVERKQGYKGQSEVGQPTPVGEHTIRFTIPGSSKTISWTSEYGEDLGRTNFELIALHIRKDTPYLIAAPNLCLAYNKWGRPNPPYVTFKHDGTGWVRIPLSELPAEFKDVNLVVNNQGERETLSKASTVSADLVKELNGKLEQPEVRTILREVLPEAKMLADCEQREQYKGRWILPNDPIARKFIDSQEKK
jgi:hypothetical protein